MCPGERPSLASASSSKPFLKWQLFCCEQVCICLAAPYLALVSGRRFWLVRDVESGLKRFDGLFCRSRSFLWPFPLVPCHVPPAVVLTKTSSPKIQFSKLNKDKSKDLVLLTVSHTRSYEILPVLSNCFKLKSAVCGRLAGWKKNTDSLHFC